MGRRMIGRRMMGRRMMGRRMMGRRIMRRKMVGRKVTFNSSYDGYFCRYLELHGLNTVGIFRVGSSKKRVRQVKDVPVLVLVLVPVRVPVLHTDPLLLS